jgi:hypothetical protein
MVAVTIGPSRWDPTCYHMPDNSLPHVVVGSDSANSERFFAAGNERTTLDLTGAKVGGKNTAYFIGKEDKFRFIVDMMNMNMEDRTMYLTMTYEFVDGPLPSGWKSIKPIWLDVNQCGTSEVHAPHADQKFTITSKPWTPNIEGDIAFTIGHLHDGGLNLEFFTNDKTMQCDSVAKYGEKPEFVYAGNTKMMNGDLLAKEHISTMTTCTHDNSAVKRVEKNQTWTIKGHYDYGKRAGNIADGEQMDIMGLGIVFVEAPVGGIPRPP